MKLILDTKIRRFIAIPFFLIKNDQWAHMITTMSIFLLCEKYWVIWSTNSYFGGDIFNDFQSSETDFDHLVLQEPACGKFFPMVMSSIIWHLNQILLASHTVNVKKIENKTEKCRKKSLSGKILTFDCGCDVH